MVPFPRSVYQAGVLWSVALSLLLPVPAGATSVLEHSFPSLVQDAEVIAVGTVTAIESAWDADNKVPRTFVTFSNLTVLKGEGGQTDLTLRFLGGPTPDGGVMQIAGVPQFALGERSVIFCVGNNYQAVPLVGVWQGVYRVVFDVERGVDTIRDHAWRPVTTLPAGDGGILHDEAPHGRGRAAQTEAAPGAMTLPTLLQRIEQELNNKDNEEEP